MSAPENDNKPKASGRVRHDAGGRAVWEWAVESGKHAVDSTSRLLKRLDLSGLHLLDHPPKSEETEAPAPPAPEVAPAPPTVPTFGGKREQDPLVHSRQSFNPYDSRSPVGRAAPGKKPVTASAKPRATQPVKQKKPWLLGRLFGKK
jgi:hypothetical protein